MTALEELDREAYEQFAESHPLGNFLQSVQIGDRRIHDGWRPHYVGIRREGVVVAATLLFSRPIAGIFRLFECQQGPLLDYDDAELLSQMLTGMAAYIRSAHGVSLRVNPPVLAVHRDTHARVVDDGYSGEGYRVIFEANAFVHQDNAHVDNDPHLLRWYYTRDLTGITSYDDFLTTIETKHRSVLAAVRRSGIKVQRVTDPAQLAPFIRLLVMTGERRGFLVRSDEYYHSMMESFGKNRLFYMMATIMPHRYRQSIQQDIAAVEQEITQRQRELQEDPTRTGALKDAQMRWAAYEKRLSACDELFAGKDAKTEIPLAAAMFIHSGPEFVYFNSGSDDHYKMFNAAYALQEWALRHAIQQGITRYNFYGTHGDFDGHPEQEGVYKFKRGFSGVVEEQLGYFVYTPRPVVHTLAKAVDGVGRRVKCATRFLSSRG